MLRDAVSCKNGHLFCRNCVGRWSVRANNSHPICECQTDVKRSTAEVVDEALRRASNRCPLCAVIGPYLTATGVDCQLDQVMVLCTRCDWAGPFVDFKTKHCCSSGVSDSSVKWRHLSPLITWSVANHLFCFVGVYALLLKLYFHSPDSFYFSPFLILHFFKRIANVLNKCARETIALQSVQRLTCSIPVIPPTFYSCCWSGNSTTGQMTVQTTTTATTHRLVHHQRNVYHLETDWSPGWASI
jgi:hypothetical protein